MTSELFSFISKNMSGEARAIFDNGIDVFETFSSSIIFVDDQFKIIYANEKALNLLGFTLQDILGVSGTKITLKKTTIVNGSSIYETLTRKDGSALSVKITISPLVQSKISVLLIEKSNKEQSVDNSDQVLLFLETILDNAPIPIYARDKNGDYLINNKMAASLFGGKPTTSDYYENISEAEPRDDWKKYNPKHETIKQNKTYVDREKEVFDNAKTLFLEGEEYIKKNGDKILVNLTKVPVKDKEGNIISVLTIAEDITKNKNIEKENLDNKHFLQKLVDNLPIAIAAKKHKGEYILWNKKSEELFGIQADDVVGKPFYQQSINQDLKDYIWQQDQIVFDSGTELDVPQELVSTPQEGVRIMHTVKTPVFNVDGTPDYLLSVSEDITVKNKMEKEIREAKEKYSLLIENSGEGVIILEGQKIIFSNPKFANILGYEKDVIVNKNIFDIVSKDHKLFFEELYNNALDSTTKTIDIKMLNSEGEDVELEVNAMHSKYMGKKIVLMFFRDATAQNELLRGLRREREVYRNSFELFEEPLAILSSRGYLADLNKVARDMFNLKKEDRHIYRNYYVRPQLSLEVRNKMKHGENAACRYIVDPDLMDPNVYKGNLEGKMALDLTFTPITKKDTRDGNVRADYIITIAKVLADGTLDKTPAATQQVEDKGASNNCEDIMLINIPTLKCAKDGSISAVNEAFKNLGLESSLYENGAMVNKIFTTKDRYSFTRDIGEMFRTGFIYSRFYLLEGIGLPVELDGIILPEETGFILTLKNNAEKQQMQDLLKERQDFRNALMNGIHGSAFFCEMINNNKVGQILTANPEAEELFGYEPKDLLEKSLEELFSSPKDENLDKTKTLISRNLRVLAKKGKSVFTTKAFKNDATSVMVEVSFSKLELERGSMLIVIVREIESLVNLAKNTSKEHQELIGIKNIIPGVMLTVDLNGVIEQVHINDNSGMDFYDFEKQKGKSPYDYLRQDVADNLLYSVKEANSVNTTVSFSFNINDGDDARSFSVSVSPMPEELKALVLIREVTITRGMERKIKNLYKITNINKDGYVASIDKILDFVKDTFDADAAFIFRFQSEQDNTFKILHTSKNDLNLETPMSFPEDACISEVRNGELVLSEGVDASDCAKSAFCKSRKVRTLLLAPLDLNTQVSCVLGLIGKRKTFTMQEGDIEFIGLVAKLLGFRLELGEASRIIDDNSHRLERTLKYLSMPAAIINLNGEIEFINDKFLNLVKKEEDFYKHKDFFDVFTIAPHVSRKDFFGIYNSNEKTFGWEETLLITDDKRVPCIWKVNIVKNTSGQVTGFMLIANLSS